MIFLTCKSDIPSFENELVSISSTNSSFVKSNSKISDLFEKFVYCSQDKIKVKSSFSADSVAPRSETFSESKTHGCCIKNNHH